MATEPSPPSEDEGAKTATREGNFLRAPAWAFRLLRSARHGRLATADAGARPHVIPVCYCFDGKHCYSSVDRKPKSGRQLRRLRNLAENPRATLLVDHWSEDWSELAWVMVRGRAELVGGGEEFDDAIVRLTEKYPQYRSAPPLSADEGGVVVKLVAETLTCWRPESYR